MNVRLSLPEDIPTLLCLAQDARRKMREDGNALQWAGDYPAESDFLADINRDCSYVITDDSDIIVGTFAFIPGPDPTYARIYSGEWFDATQPYYVIHRIAGRRGASGVFEAMLSFCFSITYNIRIDTHRSNSIMRHLLQKHGFAYCGIIYLANGDERLAFQKILSAVAPE